MKEYIPRTKYDTRILPFINKPVIKVLIGQRRVGKSYLLAQVQDAIKQAGEPYNFIYVDKEDEEYAPIATAADLTEHIKSKSRTDAVNYVLVDEIQEIQDFENSIRSFAAKPNYDIYITGSNSQLLSGELATRLSGRYIEIQVYSLDFKEFTAFHNLKNDSGNLPLYLKFGGMPFLRHLELKEAIAFEYLRNVYIPVHLPPLFRFGLPPLFRTFDPPKC